MARTAYISSTYNDLKVQRRAVYKALRKIHYDVICMEDYVATDERNVDKCRAHASTCDLYIGIVGKRYGYVPPEQNPSRLSITELEYRAARSSNRTIRLFLLDEDAPGPKTREDAGNERKLKALRSEVSQISYGPFRTVPQLVEQVLAACYTADAQARIDAGLDGLRSANMMPLESSGLVWITDRIQQAIKASESVAALQIRLGSGDAWWSTRLYLVAALMEEYTSIPQIVFLGRERADMAAPFNPALHEYLGMCSPAEVRRALASHFRDVERAYRASLPEQVFDPVNEVPSIVARFAENVKALAPGGEPEVKQWVAPHVLQGWHGFRSDAIEMTNRTMDEVLLDEILARRTSYVALVRSGNFDALIDRAELATRMARAPLRSLVA